MGVNGVMDVRENLHYRHSNNSHGRCPADLGRPDPAPDDPLRRRLRRRCLPRRRSSSVVGPSVPSSGMSISMKMHSPGQVSAAWITSPTCRAATHARLPDPPGSLSGPGRSRRRRRCRPRAGRTRRAVIDAQPVTRAQVLVDPHTHGGGNGTAGSVYIGSSVTEPADQRTPAPPPHSRPAAARTPGIDRTATSTTRGRGCATSTTPSCWRTSTRENTVRRRVVRRPRRHDRRRIFEEIRSRVQETDMSVPVESGPWWYVTSTVEGSSYPIHHRGPTRRSSDRARAARRERRGGRPRVLRRRRVRHVSRSHAWPPGRSTPRATSTTRCRSATSPPAVDLADEVADISNAGVGVVARRRVALLRDVRRSGTAVSAVWRHASARPRSRRRLRVRRDRRALLRRESARRGPTTSIVIQSTSKTSSEMRLLSTDDPTDDPVVVRPAARRRRVQHRSLGRRARHAHERRLRSTSGS